MEQTSLDKKKILNCPRKTEFTLQIKVLCLHLAQCLWCLSPYLNISHYKAYLFQKGGFSLLPWNSLVSAVTCYSNHIRGPSVQKCFSSSTITLRILINLSNHDNRKLASIT